MYTVFTQPNVEKPRRVKHFLKNIDYINPVNK